ncbi:sigma-70 family RNA polymerase sigma factor [Nonomuraea sp. MG754425]|uniref:sigma-70 family RNA polymerase sigma factor n=1 Tax=Nonomuraea sp. MG754425 TaxID=2570319 RepID=UPI001F003754|nr:sigma-70 family RNA polymerase sigma factor [Nonomuraea sp. MG754425]MCF6469402.1 sigma-70 family RNA polymerase sigma factor [Nonomuraea sp. MG754425]
MSEHDLLTDRFEEHRGHLRAVAHQILGSAAEADDAVQEAWLRLNRSYSSEVENLRGWLTTVVARVALTMLRSRTARSEDPLDAPVPHLAEHGDDPEHQAILSDSVGLALLVVLDTLPPNERLAFVLHDMFAVPFEEIAPIVDRTPAAARKLASRARRRVQGAAPSPDTDLGRQREIVRAFLAASRRGDFNALLEILHPDAVLRADRAATVMGASGLVHGASAIADTLSGRAVHARLALIDGVPGALWTQADRPRVAFTFTTSAGRITEIDLIANSEHLRTLELVLLNE